MIDRLNPECDLEVDGGIDPRHGRLAFEAGANVLVAGSAVFGDSDGSDSRNEESEGSLRLNAVNNSSE